MSISPDMGAGGVWDGLMICLRSMVPPRIAIDWLSYHTSDRAASREETFQEARQRPVVDCLGQKLGPLLVAPAIGDDRPAPEFAEVHVRVVPVHRPGDLPTL